MLSHFLSTQFQKNNLEENVNPSKFLDVTIPLHTFSREQFKKQIKIPVISCCHVSYRRNFKRATQKIKSNNSNFLVVTFPMHAFNKKQSKKQIRTLVTF